jgi:hypothetical protein
MKKNRIENIDSFDFVKIYYAQLYIYKKKKKLNLKLFKNSYYFYYK